MWILATITSWLIMFIILLIKERFQILHCFWPRTLQRTYTLAIYNLLYNNDYNSNGAGRQLNISVRNMRFYISKLNFTVKEIQVTISEILNPDTEIQSSQSLRPMIAVKSGSKYTQVLKNHVLTETGLQEKFFWQF